VRPSPKEEIEEVFFHGETWKLAGNIYRIITQRLPEKKSS
jgi:hypothetical protein